MEAVVHLDTHVVAWLYADDRDRLRPVRKRLDESELVISPMVTLELEYLREIGRLRVGGQDIVSDLVARIGLRLSTASMAHVVGHAIGLSWTRDPFDRIIVAQAMADGVPLVTKDASIREHFRYAEW
jgi:PIN domain nuclease of toxin-antitoxin system